jgi:hypothetical protein
MLASNGRGARSHTLAGKSARPTLLKLVTGFANASGKLRGAEEILR